MATVRQIIKRAQRLLPNLYQGPPDAEDEDRGLDALQALINDLSGWGGSYPYTEIYLDASYEVSKEEPALRFMVTTTGLTITLPKCPYDGARIDIVQVGASLSVTINPNGLELNGSTSSATITTAATYMFRADTANWAPISSLALGDTFPYPSEFDRAFASILAMEISAEEPNAPPPTPKVIMMADDGRRRLYARYVPRPHPQHDAAIRQSGAIIRTLTDWTNYQ